MDDGDRTGFDDWDTGPDARPAVWRGTDFNVAARFLDAAPPERTALVTTTGTTSYGELAAMASRVGHALRALGVGKGDRVLIALRDSVEYVALWYGAQKIGAIVVELYSHLKPADYRYHADYIDPKIVVGDAATLDALRAARVTGLLVTGVHPSELVEGEHHLATLLAAQPTTLPPVPMAEHEQVMWKLTTGSTGRPKACLVPARAPSLSFEWVGRGVLDLRPDDVVLAVPKLFFGYARDMVALYPFGVGAASILFGERTTPERIFELIERYQPTILVNVPTMMRAMLTHPGAAGRDLSCLRMCTSAGEALPPELHRRWLDTFGVEVVDLFGSAEVYHGFLANRPGRVRIGSLGQAVPGYRVRVVDDAGQDVPDGRPGRLEVVGETAALGYWRHPEESAAVFPAAHTVRSGDLVRRDADGYFYYLGRADDMLKVRGVWVAPTEIENSIAEHPAVSGCAVVGHRVDGLVAALAFVVLRRPVEVADLREFIRSRLAPHKRPHEVRFVASLPQTASGKVDRAALRAGA
ncbi:benzoate-CoA ligase family protein [Actinokineospora baliensis]|uniref:benzoate-CoA ligase family protein n=1 Tax=Actinokineospora baliensis TaxID=547056 RepID=UPI00195BC7D7|nr:benzoate-CoA ligase family protein [Actinokineospora baliensis]MBM7774527.1 benzoate-CoA ligase family protein [Actinokineospora baliensis]